MFRGKLACPPGHLAQGNDSLDSAGGDVVGVGVLLMVVGAVVGWMVA